MSSVLAGGKMEGWCTLSKMKSWLLLILVIIVMMVSGIKGEGGCIEEERKALLQIKTSLFHDSLPPVFKFDPLPSWVNDGDECCDWERVKCNTTTRHITHLSLTNIMGISEIVYYDFVYGSCKGINWPLNVSLFLHFKELTSLDLSHDCLDDGIVNTGLGRLSSLKKLETLDLSWNLITNVTFPSLGALTSLRVLNLRSNLLDGYFPVLALENLEILNLTGNKLTGLGRLSSLNKLEKLDLSWNHIRNETFSSLGALTSIRVLHLDFNELEGYFPALALENLEILDLHNNNMEGFEQISLLKKLKILNLGGNKFTKSFITSLSALPMLKSLDLSVNGLDGLFPVDLPMLKSLDLSGNGLDGLFPVEELVHLTNLEELDLSSNEFNRTPSIKECTRLSRLKNLKSINLQDNEFNTSIISCLSALSSLKTLDLSGGLIEKSFPIQAFTSFHHLEVLDLSYNEFVGSIPSTINTLLPSITAISFDHNMLNGSLLGFCELKNLHELDLSHNMFDGNLPQCFNRLSSLKLLDISSNQITGTLPPSLIPNLTYLSFAHNMLNGSLLGLCELKSLHELDLSGNMFDGNLPQCFNRMSSLKLLDISSNQITGTLMPSLIANLTSLEYINLSDNKFEGAFSFSSFSSHTKLEVVRFRCNNDKFVIETEEPMGWIPMFQLKVLVISGCNINRLKGSVVPGFLLHQRMLRVIDLSHNSLVHNSLVGQFPNRLIENNTMLEALILRNNSFGGTICLPLHTIADLTWLDMSENHMIGSIPSDIQKFFPYLTNLNLSRNFLNGSIPSSIGDMSQLGELDLSDNELSGEVPKGLLTNSSLDTLKLSENLLHGMVLSANVSFGEFYWLALDNNRFTGKIGNATSKEPYINILNISNNFFTGTIPHWISNMTTGFELVARKNSLEGRFPCGKTPFSFLDISENSFSGPIPSCLNFQEMMHLHLGSNKFTGSIPNAFRNLTGVLTLDIGNNSLSGRIPEFLGNLSNLRILILRENNFIGSIPKQLCQLSNVSLIDLSSNSLSGSIPSCLQNIISPINPVFIQRSLGGYGISSWYYYQTVLSQETSSNFDSEIFEIQDEVQFTIKTHSRSYKGHLLDLMVGLDLSCNKLVGEIPKELGLLTQIHSLNLSHNRLTGTIPMSFSNLTNIESLDLSYNGLSGSVPSELIKLNSLSFFNVSYNNLSGRLPDMKAQFSTFTNESYQGNPLLCGLPLEKKCTSTSQVTDPSGREDNDKWYDMDMVSFYGSSGATWVVFLLGFVAVLYINPYWRRRWLDFVEECMYTCYYFLDDSLRKLSLLFRK